MTREAVTFNEQYNLSISPSAFHAVSLGDITNELAGQPKRNIVQIIIRFLKNPISTISLVILLGLVLTSVIAPLVSNYSDRLPINTVPGETISVRNLPPSGQWKTISVDEAFISNLKIQNFVEGVDYVVIIPISPGYQTGFISYNVWKLALQRNEGLASTSIFGTNQNSIDIWTTTWSGLWYSIRIAFFVTIISSIVGTILGLWVGFYIGTFIDIMFSRIIQAYNSIPSIIWLFILVNIFPQDFWGLFGYFMLFSWISFFGTARFYMSRFLQEEYLKAAKTIGVSKLGRALKHGLPNFIGRIFFVFALVIESIIIGEATLSLFGYSFNLPNPSLGKIIYDLSKIITDEEQRNLAYILLPTLIFTTVIVSLFFISYGVEDAIDPKRR